MVIKHKNEVLIESDLIKTATYIPDTVMVTKGQPVDPVPIIKVIDGSVIVILNSGRKRTAPVAKKFIELSGGKGHMFTPLGGEAGFPKELNFMFGLHLEFNDGRESDIYLGQGGTKTLRNPWWIGSPDLSIANPAKLLDFIVSDTDLKTELGDAIDSIQVPPKYKVIADFLQIPIKHLTKKVNIFKIY